MTGKCDSCDMIGSLNKKESMYLCDFCTDEIEEYDEEQYYDEQDEL